MLCDRRADPLQPTLTLDVCVLRDQLFKFSCDFILIGNIIINNWKVSKELFLND